MANSINTAPVGGASDQGYGSQGQPHPDTASAPSSAGAGEGAQDPADFRLVIEDDAEAGSFVYKTIDRRTGKVVQQYPREQVLKLREASDYHAGAVIRAKV